MEKFEESETFNVERLIADSIKRIIDSGQQHSHENRIAFAKQMIKAYNIPEIPYKYPETSIEIGGKSHGIDACDYCQIQTHQTATEHGWTCDRCGKPTN